MYKMDNMTSETILNRMETDEENINPDKHTMPVKKKLQITKPLNLKIGPFDKRKVFQQPCFKSLSNIFKQKAYGKNDNAKRVDKLHCENIDIINTTKCKSNSIEQAFEKDKTSFSSSNISASSISNLNKTAYFYKSSPSKCLNKILNDSDISMQNASDLSMYSAASNDKERGEKEVNARDFNVKKVSDYSYHFSGYLNEIFMYMNYLESKYKVNVNYMESRACSINPKMRSVLIFWLIEVQMEFCLLDETLYLTIFILDRYLQDSIEIINPGNLQLVGATCMLIAAKYSERNPPEICDFVYISDNAYNTYEIRDQEKAILRAIDFEINMPLPCYFLWYNYHSMKITDQKVYKLAQFILEISLTEYSLVGRPSSLKASCSLNLAIKILKVSQPQNSDNLLSMCTEKGALYADIEKTMYKTICNNIQENKNQQGKVLKQKYANLFSGGMSVNLELESYVVPNP